MKKLNDAYPYREDGRSIDARIQKLIEELNTQVLPFLPEVFTNNNGTCLRIGPIQACWFKGFGGSVSGTWIYPKPFSKLDYLGATMSDSGNNAFLFGVNLTFPTLTQVNFRKRYFDGVNIADAAAEDISFLAIGEWK